jgi:SAM-dependent methyltransferase
MVEASIRNARSAGLNAEFLNADMADLDLHDRTFDGAYITPLVYSFVPGRSRRIECLRRLGRHLTPGGAVIFSAHLVHRLSHLLRLLAVTMRRRLRRQRDSEFGDWFTWFLTPDGRIERAFSHRFFKWQVHAEARAAGFQSCEFVGQDHFVARGFRA